MREDIFAALLLTSPAERNGGRGRAVRAFPRARARARARVRESSECCDPGPRMRHVDHRESGKEINNRRDPDLSVIPASASMRISRWEAPIDRRNSMT